MLAVTCTSQSADQPLTGLTVGERPAPGARDGWVNVDVKAVSLNHHDLWSLRGIGLAADRLPMILGCDAAGTDSEGNEVVVHAVVSSPEWDGDETLDPKRTLLSELHQGTMAEQVIVPAANLVLKPASLSFEEAACLPTAWLTAYRMLTTQAQVQEGQTVLVQGAGGGVASAAITLGHALGATVWATSRSEDKKRFALRCGADATFDSGERLPGKVDVVIETVGEATWSHSLRALRPGGCVVVSGATSGPNPKADLSRVFFLQLRVLGSTMGTREELEAMVGLLQRSCARPIVSSTMPLANAPMAFERMESGNVMGKIVLTV